MKALMLIPLLKGHLAKISVQKCNITIKDPKCWFDFDRCVGDFRFKMEDPYERAVAYLLIQIVAGHQT